MKKDYKVLKTEEDILKSIDKEIGYLDNEIKKYKVVNTVIKNNQIFAFDLIYKSSFISLIKVRELYNHMFNVHNMNGSLTVEKCNIVFQFHFFL